MTADKRTASLLDVPCITCAARPGEKCFTSTGHILEIVHVAREHLARYGRIECRTCRRSALRPCLSRHGTEKQTVHVARLRASQEAGL